MVLKCIVGDDSKTISINCESTDIEGVSRKQIATHVIGLIITEGIRNNYINK